MEPYDGSLHLGMQLPLMGDLHKMRNDLLKHNSIATENNTGRCEELKWFAPGQDMHLTLNHVIEVLHKLGMWKANVVSPDPLKSILWRSKGSIDTEKPRRAVSFLSGILQHPS